jgi:hypothetical protein
MLFRLRAPLFRRPAGVAFAALLLAACGGGNDRPSAELEGAKTYNAVALAASGGASVDGSFERTKGYLAQGNQVLRGSGVVPQAARFTLTAPEDGYYEVFASWPQAADGAGRIQAEVSHADGVAHQDLDQSVDGGQWNSLGVYRLRAGSTSSMTLRSPAGVHLFADAVRVQWVGHGQPDLKLASTELPVADRDDDYETYLTAWGGPAPFRFSLGSALPDGLAFDDTTGRLYGVPAEAGEFRLNVTVIDGIGRRAAGTAVLHVVLSNDTPGSVPKRPFQLTQPRERALSAGNESGSGAQLGSLPAIVRAMPEGSWAKVNLNPFSDVWAPEDLRPLYANSNPTPAKIITAWSSFAWDSNRGNLMLYGGGHANYRGNEVYLWRGATQRWERASLPSAMKQDALGNWNAIDGADAAPASAHTYDNTLFFPGIDRLVVVGGAADSNGGHYLRMGSDGNSRTTGFYMFDPSRAHPDRVGGSTGSHVQRVAPYPEVVGGSMWSNRDMIVNTPNAPVHGWVNGCAANYQENGVDVAYFRSVSTVYRLTMLDASNPASDVWEKVGVKWFGSGTKATCTFDTNRRILLRTATQTVPFVYWNMAAAAPSNKDVTVVPADPTGTFMPALASNAISIANCGLEYDPPRGNYKLWCGGGSVWQLTPPAVVSPNGWSITPLSPAAGAVPDPTVANGVLGKWKYIQNLDVFMALQDSVQGNVWVYKPVGWVDPFNAEPGNVPPTVGLTAPANGNRYLEGEAIELVADAADLDGQVLRVEFFAGGTLLGQATSAPYTLNWIDAPVGSHSLTARATDDRGATTTSAPVTVNVDPLIPPPLNLPPSVSLQQPLAGSAFTQGQAITVAALADDIDGAVQRVEFYAGMLKIGESAVAPYGITWTNAPAGPHMLTAIATDDDGAQSVSQSVTITVQAPTGTVQTVTLQRGVHAGSVMQDTYLSDYSRTKNYGAADSLLDLSKYNLLLRAAIFQSEGGPVPNGATIESAVVSVYKSTSYAMTYGLHRMLQPWSETTATWNERLPGVPWGAPGGRVPDVDYAAIPEAAGSVSYDPGWLNFDITASLQAMGNSPVLVNHGWRLQPNSGAVSSLKRFHSSEYTIDSTLRPKLVISYR